MKYTSDIDFTQALESNDNPPIFWSWVWNGPLTQEKIRKELDDFAEAGIRGLYIIPEPKEFRPTTLRTYLEPPYMSDDYLKLYRYAVEYALSKDIKLWLYDEGGWPSGGACGLTKKAFPDSDPRVLSRRETEPAGGVYSPSRNTLAAFDRNGVRIKPGSACDGRITEYFSEPHYCGVNLVDLTRKDVTRAFLSTTHEKYLSSLRDLVAEKIPYMFTDEPQLVDFAWSDDLPSRFITEFGYDILDYLPELFSPSTERGEQALIDYKKLLGILFDENFLTPCADWCHAHGMGLCGHLDQDNILEGSPAGQYGSGLRLLRRFDLPGVDVIWQQIFPGKPVDGFSFFPKLASSAARQSGSELSLSESFAVYGDGLTSDQMRYVINYQFLLGINVFNFMTLPYGREKALAVNMRPMPCPEKPGFFSMDHIYKPTELLSKLMSTGKRACDTALYLPSADISLGGEIGKKAADSFTARGEKLLAAMIDFDIIDDEAILNAKHSKEGLRVGRALYRHIVIPKCVHMPEDVRKIAKKYPGRGISIASCSRREIRLTARQSNSEVLYFVFNPAKKAITFELDFDYFVPNARLDLMTGKYLPPDAGSEHDSGVRRSRGIHLFGQARSGQNRVAGYGRDRDEQG